MQVRTDNLFDVSEDYYDGAEPTLFILDVEQELEELTYAQFLLAESS